MKVAEKIRSALVDLERDRADRVEVSPMGAGRVLVAVVSSAFRDKPEEERQRLVWGKLLEQLDDSEQSQIEYIFTRTPSELSEMLGAEPGA